MLKKMSSLDKGTATSKKKAGKQLKAKSNFDVNVSAYPTHYQDLMSGSYPVPKGVSQKDVKGFRRSSGQRYKNDLSNEIYANATSGLRKVATRPLKKK